MRGKAIAVKVEFGLRIMPSVSPSEVLALTSSIEAGGWDIAWFADSQMIARDPYALLGAAAIKTRTIKIGTNVTNTVLRHPSTVASAISTINELSGGRALLGIGAGDSSVRLVGLKPSSMSEMERSINIIRSLLQGKSAYKALDGQESKVQWAEPRSSRIPIYLSASGPKMMQLAGKVADGVITLAGIAPKCLSYITNNLRIGAESAGRDVSNLKLICGTFVHITSEQGEAIRLSKPILHYFIERNPDVLAMVGLDLAKIGAGDVSKVRVYPDFIHAEDWRGAVSKGQIPDELVEEFADKFCVIGTPDECVEKLKTATRHGVNNFYIRHLFTYNLPSEVAEVLARDVIPHFR